MHNLYVFLLSSCIFWVTAASAAPPPGSYSVRCEAQEDVDDKLACYREAVRVLEGRDRDAGAAAKGSAGSAIAPPAAQPSVPQAPSARGALPAEQPPAAAARVHTQAPSDTDHNDGPYAVAEVSRSRRGKVTVVLQNGEVWRQLDSDGTRVSVPDEVDGVMAEIKRGALGSDRMQLTGAGRPFRVRRVR